MSFDEPALLTIMLSPSTKSPSGRQNGDLFPPMPQLLTHSRKVVAQKHVALRKACPKCVFIKRNIRRLRRRGI